MATPLEDVATWELSPGQTAPAAPSSSPPAAQPSPFSAVGERCPSCQARVAADQRYCLECGRRRGDPRLPFMDAVSFMDGAARKRHEQPPASPPRRLRVSANASLIAGVGTLVLAMGVGVLIGRSGGQGGGTANTKPAVQVVKIPAASEAAGTVTAAAPSGKTAKPKASGRAGGGSAKLDATAASGKGAESVLQPKVKLSPSTTQVGGSCNEGAGCKSGKFTGEFFGE